MFRELHLHRTDIKLNQSSKELKASSMKFEVNSDDAEYFNTEMVNFFLLFSTITI